MSVAGLCKAAPLGQFAFPKHCCELSCRTNRLSEAQRSRHSKHVSTKLRAAEENHQRDSSGLDDLLGKIDLSQFPPGEASGTGDFVIHRRGGEAEVGPTAVELAEQQEIERLQSEFYLDQHEVLAVRFQFSERQQGGDGPATVARDDLQSLIEDAGIGDDVTQEEMEEWLEHTGGHDRFTLPEVVAIYGRAEQSRRLQDQIV